MLNVAGGIILAVLFFIFLEQILALGAFLLATGVGLLFVGVLIIGIIIGIETLLPSETHISESHSSLPPIIILVTILVWVIISQIKSSNVSIWRRLKRWHLKWFDHKPGCANRLEEFDDETKKQEIITREKREANKRLKREKREANKRLKEEQRRQEKHKEQEYLEKEQQRLQEKRKEQERIKLEYHRELLSFLKKTSSFSNFQITSEDSKVIISHPLLPKCYIEAEAKIYTTTYDNNIGFIITRFENGQVYGSPDMVFSQKSAVKKITSWLKSVDLIVKKRMTQ